MPNHLSVNTLLSLHAKYDAVYFLNSTLKVHFTTIERKTYKIKEDDYYVTKLVNYTKPYLVLHKLFLHKSVLRKYWLLKCSSEGANSDLKSIRWISFYCSSEYFKKINLDVSSYCLKNFTAFLKERNLNIKCFSHHKSYFQKVSYHCTASSWGKRYFRIVSLCNVRWPLA